MKTRLLFSPLLVLVLIFSPKWGFNQSSPDTLNDYYSITAYYDHYYDSLIQIRGIENMKGTGYKDYIRWKWFYSTRHGVDGNLSIIWEVTDNYYENSQMPEGYVDESSWEFFGPYGFPVESNGNSKITGKGMALCIWVSEGNHSLIYTGSHHGGLWKTTDGGENWFPLNDNHNRIKGISSLAVNSQNNDIIYITCNNSLGEFSNYSEGLFKSIDAGNSWTLLTTPITYPSGSWATKIRKITLDPNNQNVLYLLSYREVCRSNDGGMNWENVLETGYCPWDDCDILPYHDGFFDFKITPWNSNLAYLAGSEVFRIINPTSDFIEENISEDVFLIGLNAGEKMIKNPHRCEISMDRNFPNTVWFGYSANYDKGDGEKKYFRIVRYDSEPDGEYSLIWEIADDGLISDLGCDANKLEFSVSPSNQNKFYIGGVKLMEVDIAPGSISEILLSGGNYPDPCWLHDDIRDMVVFSHNSKDTLFLADDSGISWGTLFEPGNNECDPEKWNWRHPCNSEKNGLNITEFYGIGSSQTNADLVAGGCQDLGEMLMDQGAWFNFGVGGDGSEIVWDPIYKNIFYLSEMQYGVLARTNDMGGYCPHFDVLGLGSSTLMIPMKLDPRDPSLLYSGNKTLFKYSGVNNFEPNAQITTEAIYPFDYPITDIEVVVMNDGARKFFISTEKECNISASETGCEGCIFRSKNEQGTISFDDIGKNISGPLHGRVTDIERDPVFWTTIYVSFGMYSDNAEEGKKVYKSTNGGNSWVDYSQGLPIRMPVYNIKFDKQSKRLFAVTDVGVFVRSAEDENDIWHPFNQNLPAKIITDIEIDPKFNSIYASSFGRGLWKSSLNCHYQSNPYTVEIGEEPWTENRTMNQDIIIPAGLTLEINGCTVYMPSDARIIVERGATLKLIGATLTSACSEPWWGVELWGDSHSVQNYATQGRVIMQDGATIEKARKAIFCGKGIKGACPDWAYTGGMISASNAYFKNNVYGIQVWTYRYQENNYVSSFNNCRFLTTEKIGDNIYPEYFMTLIQVKGININNCVFENTLNDNFPTMTDRGSGIFAYDASFNLGKQESGNDPLFRNLYFGIYALNAQEEKPFSIEQVNFEGNLTGIYARGINGIRLVSNSFLIEQLAYPANNILGGVYLDYCSGFTIEENSFFSIGDRSSLRDTKIGITINNSGDAQNAISNNTFTNLHIGSLAQNDNRGGEPWNGLQILCGSYSNNDYDIAVTVGEGCSHCGISWYQGSDNRPTGNLFSLNGSQLYSDINNEGDPIEYFHHAADLLNPPNRWIPSFYTPNITLHNLQHYPYNPQYCESQVLDKMTFSQLDSVYNCMTITSDSLRNQQNQLVDGGNTDILDMDISFSQPEDAVDLMDELLELSPYLSDTILIKAAEKEDVLIPAMVQDIMMANPQSASSDKVMEALENRENQLSVEMMEEIMVFKDTLAPIELLESEISSVDLIREIAFNRLISLFRADTAIGCNDILNELLEDHNTLTSKYQLLMNYLETNDTMAARNLLSLVPQQFNLTNSQLLTHDHWNDLADILISLKSDTISEFSLDSLAIEKLIVLSQFEDIPACKAQNILQLLGITEISPFYILPVDGQKSYADNPPKNRQPDSNSESYIKLYPNPAKNYIIVEYCGIEDPSKADLRFFSASGSLQFYEQLSPDEHFYVIRTKEWPDGIYFYNFNIDNQAHQSGKIIISK
jgi:hypothetical protein